MTTQWKAKFQLYLRVR